MKIMVVEILKNDEDNKNVVNVVKVEDNKSHEHSSVGSTMHYYMQGLGFEPWTPHLFTL